MSTPVDVTGRELKVGQRVAKASRIGNAAHLEVKTVTRVSEAGRVYLDGWHQPIQRTSLVCIVGDQLPLTHG